jgi:D-beta-D-heptose 7-phosphate kinase/D-beta-D-heptose 1-phosphate adenosyltransferase
LESADLNIVLDAGEAMVSELDLEFLTATLSDKGIGLLRPGNRFMAPAVARQVFDVSGAGDTVIAVLALCAASGLKPETAVELANLAAGIVVGKVGTVPVEKDELLAALAQETSSRAADKVIPCDELTRRVALWKVNGERVVFSSGRFDQLNIGHIAFFEQARRFGDRLIVAINGDLSVTAAKGTNSPVVGVSERARVLAALAAVDAVVIYGESTPLEIILATRPAVIVRGGDNIEDAVVGTNEVQSWGGQVKRVSLVDGLSSTQLNARSMDTINA